MRTQKAASSISRTLTFLLLMIGTMTTAYGTELTPLCDPIWQVIDSLTITSGSETIWRVANDGEAEWIVIVIQSSQGDTAITIDPESITFSGTCAELDTAFLAGLFDNLVLESIRQAVDSGAIATSENPSSPAEIEVYVPTCVTSLGSGSATTYMNVSECTQGIRFIQYANLQGIFGGTIYATAGETTCTTGTPTINDTGGLE